MGTKNRKAFIISAGLLIVVMTIAMAYVTVRQQSPSSGKSSASESHPRQFVCSMHPEVVADAPGDCPICEMSLIEKIDPSTLPAARQFVCSMHPEVLMEDPGDCPICGMGLIEKIVRDSLGADTLLSQVVLPVNESVLATVATVSPVEESLALVVEAYGTISYDPRSIHTISARYKGLVERSFVRYPFQPIHKGQKIYQVYCPEIYNEGWQYVRLIQTYPDRADLTIDALEWFHLLGLTEGQIDSLKRSVKPNYHLTVYSDAEGVAVSADFDPEAFQDAGSGSVYNTLGSDIGFNEGKIIEAGTPLFRMVNPKALRADLKVRTEEVGLLKQGQKVLLTDPGYPDSPVEGVVSQVEPLNGDLFQWVKVFFTDPRGRMKPGGQIKGHILAGHHKALWLPLPALYDQGERSVVYVWSKGRFVATALKTGLICDNKAEVLEGIDGQTQVASNARLLMDSDSN